MCPLLITITTASQSHLQAGTDKSATYSISLFVQLAAFIQLFLEVRSSVPSASTEGLTGVTQIFLAGEIADFTSEKNLQLCVLTFTCQLATHHRAISAVPLPSITFPDAVPEAYTNDDAAYKSMYGGCKHSLDPRRFCTNAGPDAHCLQMLNYTHPPPHS